MLKMQNMISGLQLVDIKTGTVYKVDEMPTNNAAPKVISATEMVPEGEDREPAKIEIGETNVGSFRVPRGGWPTDTKIYNAIVADGILQIEGKDITMGAVVAKDVIKVFPGVVIFTANDTSVEGLEAVYAYTVVKDTMDKLGYMLAGRQVIEDSETRVVYGYSATKDVEVERDGKKVTKTIFDEAYIYVLTQDKVRELSLCDGDMEEDLEYDHENQFLGFDFDKVVIAQGDKYFYVPTIVTNSKTVVYDVYRISNEAEYDDAVEMPAPLTAVTQNNSNAKNLGLIFSGEGFVKIDDFVMKSDELKGYIYLAEAVRDRANYTSTYVLMDEEYNFKTIVRKSTKDRGDIVTIE